MSELSEKIYEILIKNNVNPEDMTNVLYNVQQDIEIKLWEKITISPIVLYSLKDTIYYNFEYLFYNEKITGRTTLKEYGKNYPVFMGSFNSSLYIAPDVIDNFIFELNDIKEKWNPNIYLANLHTKYDFDWRIGEENPSPLIIYNEGETPMTYGFYNNTYSGIIDSSGNSIKRDDEIVLCSIKKIDLYREYNLLTQLLDNLYNKSIDAKNNNKGLCIDLTNYNYQ